MRDGPLPQRLRARRKVTLAARKIGKTAVKLNAFEELLRRRPKIVGGKIEARNVRNTLERDIDWQYQCMRQKHDHSEAADGMLQLTRQRLAAVKKELDARGDRNSDGASE